MYERSAIVLERYFENLLEYKRECNIRDNFINYCELIEKLEKYQANYQKEFIATQDFSESVRKVKSIQELQNKLYKRSVKLEYNRNLLFTNVDAKVDEIRKCIEKVEDDVDKNNEAMKEIKESLLSALTDYNDKRYELSKCKRYKKMAENAYNECIEKTRINFEGITEEIVEKVKQFANFNDLDDIINTLDTNGKDEKIPFNEGVISNATSFGVELAKKEACGYLVIYYKMQELLTDIDNGTTQVENYKKVLVDEKSKMDFLYASKDYIFQFLDYERMTVIHGRKSHNRLMNEACENFNQDVQQINNLYVLLEKEIEDKATKKSYTDLYNKSYLKDIQDKEEKFKKEKNRVNLNTATLINSNYWRIDGIKAIYTVFYNSVSVALGKMVDEFDMPKEIDEDQMDETDEENEIENDNEDINNAEDTDSNSEEVEDVKKEEKKEEKKKTPKPKAPKVPFAIEATIEDILAESENLEDFDDEELEDEDGELDLNSITKKAKQISSNNTISKKVEQNDDDIDEEDFEDDSDNEENEDYNDEENDIEDIEDIDADADDKEENDDEDVNDDNLEDDKKITTKKDEDEKKIKSSFIKKPILKSKIVKETKKEIEEDEEDEDDFDIFGEKYKEIDFSENNFMKSKMNSYNEDLDEEDDDDYEDDEIDEEENMINASNNEKKNNFDTDEIDEDLDEEDNYEDLDEDDIDEEEEKKEPIVVKKKSTIPQVRKRSTTVSNEKPRLKIDEPEADETPKRGRKRSNIEELDLDSLREAQKALLEITGKKRGRKKKNTEEIW